MSRDSTQMSHLVSHRRVLENSVLRGECRSLRPIRQERLWTATLKGSSGLGLSFSRRNSSQKLRHLSIGRQTRKTLTVRNLTPRSKNSHRNHWRNFSPSRSIATLSSLGFRSLNKWPVKGNSKIKSPWSQCSAMMTLRVRSTNSRLIGKLDSQSSYN